ncbi:unnamed protein product [Parnassius mnemosyne]|uniref:Uncharacterized protein n=1 Tax=Parnassius mnemosyne TaxID=213953 RepID=A0AAV1LW56_9NEOP
MNVAAGKSVTSWDINKNVTKKNTKSKTSEITSERNFIANSGEEVVQNDIPEKEGIRTKKLHDNSSDSDSDCSVQYADSSDYDSIEDMQDYLLRQLTEDQKMEEKEKDEQMTELETKGHETESLRTEYDKGKEEWLKQEIEDQIKELEKKRI